MQCYDLQAHGLSYDQAGWSVLRFGNTRPIIPFRQMCLTMDSMSIFIVKHICRRDTHKSSSAAYNLFTLKGDRNEEENARILTTRNARDHGYIVCLRSAGAVRYCASILAHRSCANQLPLDGVKLSIRCHQETKFIYDSTSWLSPHTNHFFHCANFCSGALKDVEKWTRAGQNARPASSPQALCDHSAPRFDALLDVKLARSR